MLFTGEINADCCILESCLEQIEYYSGTERRTGQFKSVKHQKGGGSMLYGLTWKGYLKKDKEGNHIYRTKDPKTGLYFTKCRDMYPQLEEIFKEFGEKHFPDFQFTQVQLNKDYQCPRHVDSSNIGESILLTLGDFTNGETIVEKEDGDLIVNSHNNPFKFNGSKYYHYTKDYKGTRYAIVFFNNRKLLKNKI